MELCQKYKKIYIYGAGKKGKRCLKFLNSIRVDINSFIVSKLSGNELAVEDIPIYSVEDIDFDDNALIIIAIRKKYSKEILEKLLKKGLTLEAIYNWNPTVDL